MKKKYVLGLFIIISLFMVTACGNKKEIDDDITDNNSNETQNENDEYDDLELYSDDTKLVFARGGGKVVFYYSGNKIIGETAYFDYQNNAAAKIALNALEKDENIDKTYVQGKYLVVEYNENEYGTLTVEDVKLTYAYLEELKKGN